MSALGRGLASLIPKRSSQSAEEALEQIDSMEEIADVPIRRETPEVAEPTEETPPAPTAATPPRKQLNVIEEFEDLDGMENAPLPAKPLVTPLTIDPETGQLRTPDTAEVVEETQAVPAADQEIVMKPTEVEATEAPKPRAKKAAVKKAKAEPSPAVPTPKVKARSVITPLVNTRAPLSAEPTGATEVPSDATIDTAIWDRHEDRVEHIAIGDIEVNPLQPRRDFDPGELEDLVQSINQHGILQPLVVLRKTGGGFELVAGERRLRAAKRLGWERVPCVVRTDVRTDRGRLEMALIENIQRQNLNPIEEAMGYQKLNEEYGLTHEEIGERVGRSRVGITNVMRVLQLPAEIQRGLAEGKISGGHARAILMIPDEEKQIKFYHHLLDEGLTVRKAETRARRIQRMMNLSDPMRKKTRGRPQLALKFDGELEEKFGYNARIKFIEEKNRFEVVFQAFSEKEAEELVGRLLGTTPLPEHVDEDVVGEDSGDI